MKGIVFTLLNELVEETFGLDVWDIILEKAALDNKGIFIATETYPDDQLFQIVGLLAEQTKTPENNLVKSFGKFMLPRLAEKYSIFFVGQTCAKTFIRSVDDIIHVEVRKLYPDASLPTMHYEDHADDQLTIIYSSPRQLCLLGEGLIEGTGDYFGVDIKIQQTQCMHQGADHCRIELIFC